MIIAVVGSGGKTTRIHRLTEKYRKAGKKVLVTTTTHMYREEGCELSGNVEKIREQLETCGYCMAGLPAENEKIKALPLEVYEAVCAYADVVLVEADGSKEKPVKFPAEHEPVIPQNADEIHIVTGLSALGKPLKEVSHRKELVQECLGIGEDTCLTPEHLQKLLEKGYLEPLKEKYSDKNIKVCPGQVNSLYERTVAALLKEQKDVALLNPAWFEVKPKLVILGGGHVGKEIAKIGSYLDFEVTVIDDRAEFVTKEAIPEADFLYFHEFDTVEEILPNTDNVFYVVVTRGHAADRICVEKILNRNYAYLGMIGSKKKIAATYEILRAHGFTEEQISSIHAPIGLKIGARTPAEIAVSVSAELILEKNKNTSSTLSAELADTKEEGILCIIIEKHGSSPRGEGSMMFVTENGILGSIGGGILECHVVEDAKKMTSVTIKDYQLSKEESAAMGMICGGSNKILFVPLNGNYKIKL